jgi:hypothetical protein
MTSAWPNKNSREQFEINEFIVEYKKLDHGRTFEVMTKRERPDYFVKDIQSEEIFGIELTSVYSDDRSVPDVHKKPVNGIEEIPFDHSDLKEYQERLIEAISKKVSKARKCYDTTYPLILSIYVNEYISIYIRERHLQELAKRHKNVFDDMAPFSEVVLWSLPNDAVFSIRPDRPDPEGQSPIVLVLPTTGASH